MRLGPQHCDATILARRLAATCAVAPRAMGRVASDRAPCNRAGLTLVALATSCPPCAVLWVEDECLYYSLLPAERRWREQRRRAQAISRRCSATRTCTSRPAWRPCGGTLAGRRDRSAACWTMARAARRRAASSSRHVRLRAARGPAGIARRRCATHGRPSLVLVRARRGDVVGLDARTITAHRMGTLRRGRSGAAGSAHRGPAAAARPGGEHAERRRSASCRSTPASAALLDDLCRGDAGCGSCAECRHRRSA